MKLTAYQIAVNSYISWETNVLFIAESPPAAYSGFAQTALHKLDQLDSAIIIDDLDMSAAELARQFEFPVNRITENLNGRRFISGDTALRIG